MRRANGYSNATWVGDGIAVRIAHSPVPMTREADLVRALPRVVGYPEVLGEGRSQGHGWIVTKEVAGRNLQEAWPTLTGDEACEAIEGLWLRARAVHEATPSLSSLVPPYGGFVPAAVEDARAIARRAERGLSMTAAARARLHAVLEDFFDAASGVRHVVNHGDLALMNALWDDQVVSLLDFEFSVLGPVEIDLCRLVLEARGSAQGRNVDSEAERIALEIARRSMDAAHGRTLILGAAVLDQLRDVDLWLDRDSFGEAIEGWRPDLLLAGLLSAERGYLAPLF
ncbi:aminoglycoside phosphotransferase family protein [Brachybacterium halotolerans subsp. kimchii]|nr:aminoglycoside phosphotransferase family protein [Brachybacterium halotolerans subsp. kimchii]